MNFSRNPCEREAAGFESDFCVSCASYISTLLEIYNGSFFACDISVMLNHMAAFTIKQILFSIQDQMEGGVGSNTLKVTRESVVLLPMEKPAGLGLLSLVLTTVVEVWRTTDY